MRQWLRRATVIFFASTLLLVGGVGWYAYYRLSDPELLREKILEWARSAIPEADVELRRAEGGLLGGVRLVDLTLQPKCCPDGRAPAVKLSAVTLAISGNIFEGDIRLERVLIDGPSLDLRRGKDGRWEITSCFKNRPLTVKHPLRIDVRNATIALCFEGDEPERQVITGLDASLSLTPPGLLTWKAVGQFPVLRKVVMEGSGNLERRVFHVAATPAQPLDLKGIPANLPNRYRETFQDIDELAGKVDLQVTGDIAFDEKGARWSGSAQGRLQDGWMEHRSLPFPVRDLNAQWTASEKGLDVQQATFAMGPARGSVQGAIPDWKVDQWEGRGTVTNVPFVDAVFRSLPIRHQQTWNRFSPEGTVDLVGESRPGRDRRIVVGSAALHCSRACFIHFPYPVERVTGDVRLGEDGIVHIDVAGAAKGRPVKLAGKVVDAWIPSVIDLELTAKGIPLDETLKGALAPPAAAVYEKFKLRGTVDVAGRVGRSERQRPVEYLFNAKVRADECVCEWFPYPCQKVVGEMSISPYRVDFREFTASAKGAAIYIGGRSVNTTEGGKIEARIHAQDVLLDDTLRAALPMNHQQTWNALRPEGRATVWCAIDKLPKQPIELHLTVDPNGSAITPVSFPYRMEGMTGTIEVHQGKAWWKDVRAHHGATTMRCSGQADENDAGTLVTLSNLVVDGLAVDPSLISALPSGARSVATFLMPEQPIGLFFRTLHWTWQRGSETPMRYAFNGDIIFPPTSLKGSLKADQVAGKVAVEGEGVGDRRRLDGNLALQTLSLNSFTAKDLTARLTVRDEDLEVSNLRASFYGGTLHGQIKAHDGLTRSYQCDLTAYKARLSEYVRQQSKSPPTIDGLVDARLFLLGKGETIDQWRGEGNFLVRDADIYRLPIIQDLFRLLSLQAPNGRAFDEVQCNFKLNNRTLVIRNLDLLGPSDVVGPSLSLFSVGEGTVDLDTLKIDLTLHPRYARGRYNIPVVTDVLNIASDSLVEIPVGGTLTNPVPLVDTLPGLRKILEPFSIPPKRR